MMSSGAVETVMGVSEVTKRARSCILYLQVRTGRYIKGGYRASLQGFTQLVDSLNLKHTRQS